MIPDSTSIPATPDVVIIGAGVVGLWCALKAKQRGLRAVVVEQGRIGQGASGGILGALMPHRPVSWEDIQVFQLEALLSLETEVAQLEAATGLSLRIQPVWPGHAHRLRRVPGGTRTVAGRVNQVLACSVAIRKTDRMGYHARHA